MFFNKKNNKNSNFTKAKTPEARKRQKAAIASYYVKKRELSKKNKKK